MIIYCTGCSHTEGVGLADNIIFPNDFPGEVHESKLNNVAWTNKRSELLLNSPFLFEQLRQENLKRAWPAYLSKITGHEVINGGVGGASILSIAMSLAYDLDELTEKKSTPDKVFVALPTISRIPILNKNPIPGYHTLAFKNVLPSFVGNVFKGYENYAKGYFESHSDEEMLTFYLYHCISIKHTVASITGSNPIFVKTYEFDDWKDIVSNSKIYLLKKYWDMLNFDSLSNQKSLNQFLDSSRVLLPDGHFKEYVHESFADYVNKTFLL